MTLDTYLRRSDAKSLTALALEIGISKGRLSQLRNASEWPPELALKAEAATGGVLSASDLSSIIAQARDGQDSWPQAERPASPPFPHQSGGSTTEKAKAA